MPAKKKGRKPKARFVLDCSVAVSWAFEDESNTYAESVADALPDAQAFVPSLWPVEVANVLVIGERRKRLTEAQVTQFLALLRPLPITIDDETTVRAWQETLCLARMHNLSVYDGTYLELAIRRDLPLATLDTELKTAAVAVGVPLYMP
jgi:predicted nucleic acid-binding protein